jgi:hypothetical protein
LGRSPSCTMAAMVFSLRKCAAIILPAGVAVRLQGKETCQHRGNTSASSPCVLQRVHLHERWRRMLMKSPPQTSA